MIWGVFDSIEISFLPAGYNHEDIDQDFSMTSSCLRCEDRDTLADGHSFLWKALDSFPHAVHVKGIES